MPTRFIKESCRSSKSLASLTDKAERVFWRLVTVADDYGRFEADPEILQADLFKRVDSRPSIAEVGACLQMITEARMLVLYEQAGKQYGQFTNFSQGEPRAKHSKFPAPPTRAPVIKMDKRSSVAVGETAPTFEVNGPAPSAPVNGTPVPTFEDVCVIYPTKKGRLVGKQEAGPLFARLTDEDKVLFRQAVQNFAASDRVKHNIGIYDLNRFLYRQRPVAHEPWRDWIGGEPEGAEDAKYAGVE